MNHPHPPRHSPVPAFNRPAAVHPAKRPPWSSDSLEFIWQSAPGCSKDGPFAVCPVDQFANLDLLNIQKLAAGETLHFTHPKRPEIGSGKLRMGWWQEEGGPIEPVLEFIPLAALPSQTGFAEWEACRFAWLDDYLAKYSEGFRLHQIHLWNKECPIQALSPADPLLYQAVMENWEECVRAILHDRTISLAPEAVPSIRETALGVAMENRGDFGTGAGYQSGCHRDYRDDDFTQAEDPDTWIPRAQRIAAMLRAAGAIDYSPLLTACGDGDLTAVEAMLQQGYPPNFTIYGHTSALLEAVFGKHSEVVRTLLAHGADPNQPRLFETSLVPGGQIFPLAGGLDSPEIFHLLMDAGADPGAWRDFRKPAVFDGAYGSVENAAAIFRRVPFTSIRGRNGQTGLHLLESTELAMCREFIPADFLDVRDGWGGTALIEAIGNRQTAKAQLLLELGASPETLGVLEDVHSLDFLSLRELTPLLVTPVQAALLLGDEQVLHQLLGEGVPLSHVAFSIDLEAWASPDAARAFLSRIREDCAAGDLPFEPDLDLRACTFDLLGVLAASECRELQKLAYLLAQHPAPRERYPEVLRPFDIREYAQASHPHLLEAWNAGRPLNSAEWLRMADQTLAIAGEKCRAFEEALQLHWNGKAESPDANDFLSVIDQVEVFVNRARALIPGLQPLDRTPSAEICATAAADFEGGVARAREKAERGEEVDMDDFLEALKENLDPGSTMDHGKLLQTAKAVIRQLQCEVEALTRRI